MVSAFEPLAEAAETDKEHKESDSKKCGVEDGVDERWLENSRPQKVDCLWIIQLLNAVLKPYNRHIRISGIL